MLLNRMTTVFVLLVSLSATAMAQGYPAPGSAPDLGWGVSPRGPIPSQIQQDSNGDGIVDTTIRFEIVGNTVVREVSYTNGQTARLVFGLDGSGRIVTVTSPVDQLDDLYGFMPSYMTTYSYDSAGLLVSDCHNENPGMLAYEPMNGCTVYERDDQGRVVAQNWVMTNGYAIGELPTVGADESTIHYRYIDDYGGNVIYVEASQGGNVINRRIRALDSDGRLVVEIFDALHTDFIEEVRSYVHGDVFTVMTLTFPDGQTATATYAGQTPLSAQGLTSLGVGPGGANSTTRWLYERSIDG